MTEMIVFIILNQFFRILRTEVKILRNNLKNLGNLLTEVRIPQENKSEF